MVNRLPLTKFAAAVGILQVVLSFCFVRQGVVGALSELSPTSSKRSIASLTGGFLDGKRDTQQAVREPCTTEGMLELSGMFGSGHRVSLCMPQTASEEYVSGNIKRPTESDTDVDFKCVSTQIGPMLSYLRSAMVVSVEA